MKKRTAERVTVVPAPALGPVIVQVIADGDENTAISLVRLAMRGTPCRVIDRGPDTVILRLRGTDRRFAIPADVIKSVGRRH